MNEYAIENDIAYLLLNQGKRTVIDREDLERCLDYHWCALRNGKTFYAVTHVKSGGIRTLLGLHSLLAPSFKKVDHEDRDGQIGRAHV